MQFSRLHAEHKLVQNTIATLIFFYWISCTWRSQYWYTSIVHNTGIKICSSIVYQYCDLKKNFFLLVYSIVVSIVIGIVEMLVPG